MIILSSGIVAELLFTISELYNLVLILTGCVVFVETCSLVKFLIRNGKRQSPDRFMSHTPYEEVPPSHYSDDFNKEIKIIEDE